MRKLLILIAVMVPLTASAKDSIIPIHDPYAKVVRQYSKRGESYNYQDMQAEIIWWATYASDEFREAFRSEYDRVYPQGQEYRAQEKAKPWRADDPEATFMVGLYAKKREMSDLGDEKSLQDINL